MSNNKKHHFRRDGRQLKKKKEIVEDTPVEEVAADSQVVKETLVEDMDALEDAQVEEVSEVDELKIKLDEMEDKFLRVSAELANIVQRNRNERELIQKYRSQDLGKKLLPVIDNLERAAPLHCLIMSAQGCPKSMAANPPVHAINLTYHSQRDR